jgi:hypothetical protein
MSGLGIDWDAEDAAEQAARQPKITKRQESVVAEPAVANAIVPPTPAAAQPMVAAPPPANKQNTQAPQSFAESIVRKVEPYVNPIHLKPGITDFQSYKDIDPYATAAHGLGEYLAYQHGIKPIVGGIAQGVSNRISNAISGVDPTIKAQINATNAKIASSEKIAAMKYGQAQGPDRGAVSTTAGRIEPTFDISPIPANKSLPDTPPIITTAPVETLPPTPETPESKLAIESEAKFGAPLADVEKHFDVKITNLKDAEILTNNYKNYINSLSGAVSNQPAGVPNGVSPINQLTTQPSIPQQIQPKPIAGSIAPKLGGQIGQFDPTSIGQPLQDPLAGRGYQTPVQDIGPRQLVAPSIANTVATGGNVTKAVNQTIANLVDEKPMGMRENYKSNKAEPIGPGAFNHLANNVGAEKAAEIWKDVYGEKNVPYKQYMEKYSQEAGKNMYGPVVPLPEGAKPGGSFGTPKYIPEFIKGGASIGGMAGAAVIPALVAAGVQSYKGNKKAVDAELKDAWNSLKSVVTMPIDVAKAAGKGDFGPFKDMLMSMNPGTLLMNEMNKRDESAIQRMIQAEKSVSKRGVAPPSNR